MVRKFNPINKYLIKKKVKIWKKEKEKNAY